MPEIHRIMPIATDWYKPRTEDRSLATNLQLSRILAGFYGKNALGLCRDLVAGMAFPTEVAEKVNTHFFEASQRIYNLPEKTTSYDFNLLTQDGATEAIQYWGKLVPELAEEFELKDEIRRLSDRPSDLLRLLSRPPSSIDSTLAYEAQRCAILKYQIGLVEVRALNAGLRNISSDVQDLLNEKLFEGVEGGGDPVIVESYHDDETNAVVGFPDHIGHRPLTAHLKRQRLTVRKIPGFGQVHKKPREKEIGPTLTKSWVKALNNGGAIHIDEAVQDSIGMRFVVMDDSIPPEQLADLMVSVIKSGIDSRLETNHPRKIPNIAKVIKDNETDADHGQSSAVNINARRKIWFEGIPTPMELIFYNRETYLNSVLEVGKKSPETGLYMGRGHELFELRRGRETIRVPFPEEIYQVENDVITTAFIHRSEHIAYGLRGIHRSASF